MSGTIWEQNAVSNYQNDLNIIDSIWAMPPRTKPLNNSKPHALNNNDIDIIVLVISISIVLILLYSN